MEYSFTELVDIDAFHSMLKSFYEATGILHGLVDSENNVISAIGWQEACTDFHRAFPISKERCLESNKHLGELAADGGTVGCQCKNGLMDYATSVVIEGRQLATLYFGQVLHAPPDMNFFRHQARECGYDEKAYLEAIHKVPIIPRERVESIMEFFVQLAQMMAHSGLDRIHAYETEEKLVELNRDLSQRVKERTKELATKNRQLATDITLRQQAEVELRDKRAQLQVILDSSPIGIGWSRNGKVEYINRKFTEMFGYRLEEIPTVAKWYQRAYPDKAFRNDVIHLWMRQVEAAKAAKTPTPAAETSITCKDGSIRHVMINISWIGDCLLANFSDITDRWQAEQRNRTRNTILELLAKGASLTETLNALTRSVEMEAQRMLCSILLLDADARHLRVGAAPSLPEFYNQAIDGLEIGAGVGSCGTAAFTRQRVVVSDIQTHPYWANYRDLASRAKLSACWSEPIFSSQGRLLGTFAIYHQQPNEPKENDLLIIRQAANLASIAIEHHQALDELERRAHTDFLTGLANRGRFMELAETEQARSARYSTPFSVLLLDIDHFKTINDRHGHKSGDAVLQALATILQRTLREVDIIGRVGGEEFAVLLPETGVKRALEVAERLRQAIADTAISTENDLPLHTTVSIGVAAPAAAQEHLDTVLRQADAALYAAKNGGRNQVCSAGTA